MYAAPYTLPMLLANVEGSISATVGGNFTVAVAFGTLTLHAGGLSINGDVYPRAVNLAAGQSVTWSV